MIWWKQGCLGNENLPGGVPYTNQHPTLQPTGNIVMFLTHPISGLQTPSCHVPQGHSSRECLLPFTDAGYARSWDRCWETCIGSPVCPHHLWGPKVATPTRNKSLGWSGFLWTNPKWLRHYRCNIAFKKVMLSNRISSTCTLWWGKSSVLFASRVHLYHFWSRRLYAPDTMVQIMSSHHCKMFSWSVATMNGRGYLQLLKHCLEGISYKVGIGWVPLIN